MSHQIPFRYPHRHISRLAAVVSLCSFLSSIAIPVLAAGKQTANKAAKGASASAKPQMANDKPSDVVGLVLQVSGSWESINGDKKVPLKQGDGVRNGWKLKRISPDGSITIARTDGENVKCPGCAACDEALGNGVKVAQEDNWMAKAISMFVKKPHTWAVAESRTGLLKKVGLQDAVVKADGGKVNLRPIFSAPRDGTLFVTLYSIANDKDPKYLMGPEGVITQGEQSVLHAPKLVPGLYRINVSTSKEELGDDSWIFVCDAQNYDKNAKQFQSAVKSSESLKSETAPNTVQQLLRAYMASLGPAKK